jgi:hypothetical protein
MGMWQRLLERFVPLMDGDVSALDQRDGVGSSSSLVATPPVRSAGARATTGQSHTAYEGAISPLTS